MGTHPSKKFENGVLVERAISTNAPGDPVEDDEFVSGTKPYKAPEPTQPRLGVKRVESAENKAVKKATKK
jgi:hypothetical protein